MPGNNLHVRNTICEKLSKIIRRIDKKSSNRNTYSRQIERRKFSNPSLVKKSLVLVVSNNIKSIKEPVCSRDSGILRLRIDI